MDNKLEKLVEILKKLRGENGCPWDREQTLKTLKPHLIEETYEVLEVMEEGGDKLKDELGDLLLQIAFQSQIKSEENEFDMGDVIDSITEKMIRRHPHVFGDRNAKNSEEVSKIWEEVKKTEKTSEERKSILDGIPKNIPAILRAAKQQKKASKVGFDWNDLDGALNKMEEELEEFREARIKKNKEEMSEELGDVMFSLINVARLAKIDPYDSLLKTINKFDFRFRYIEKNTDIKKATLEEMEKLWEEAKNESR